MIRAGWIGAVKFAMRSYSSKPVGITPEVQATYGKCRGTAGASRGPQPLLRAFCHALRTLISKAVIRSN